MIRIIVFLLFIKFYFPSTAQIDPVNVYGQLFVDVQTGGVFEDSKTFTDCTPKTNPVKILADYRMLSSESDFDLKEFVLANFNLPESKQNSFASDLSISVEDHIENLWDVLTREPVEQEPWTSLISLPENYVVPGGRFREIYYWDSYFTMLGLAVSGHQDLVKSMLDNFALLIEEYGFIPNGNRTYYLSRSQPPFFSLMVELWGSLSGKRAAQQYLPALEREYAFWMHGKNSVDENNRAMNHVVWMEDGVFLNRYWDYLPQPRPESYKEDIHLARAIDGNKSVVYTHLRAAAESGWDFSSRWFSDEQTMESIRTTDILPVDLNCLLYHLELTISNMYFDIGNNEAGNVYLDHAFNRKNAILKYFWDREKGFFTDFNFVEDNSTGRLTMATAFPLFFSLADRRQAKQTVSNMLKQLESEGGFLTTLIASGEQWDKPNGWPPLQYIGIKALQNYGYARDARRVAGKWLTLNEDVFRRTGRMMEKYNVVDLELEAGGGEYPLQDGFGWTNGVYLVLKNEFGKK
jgi:alpha,alpha-trehalase